MTSRKIPESAVENLVSDLEGKANVENTVTTNTNQTITGQKSFTNSLRRKSTNIDITTQSENYTANNGFQFVDKNENVMGYLENAQTASGEIKTGIHARNKDGYQSNVSVIVPPSGTTGAYATAPHTPDNAPNNAIVTKDKIANMVTTNTAQTISGVKTFTGGTLKANTPLLLKQNNANEGGQIGFQRSNNSVLKDDPYIDLLINTIRFIGVNSNNTVNITLQVDLENKQVLVPTPALTANDTQAATTAWVNTKVGGFANTNASNFTATGKQTVVGWGMPDYSAGVSKRTGVDNIAECDGMIAGDSGVFLNNNFNAYINNVEYKAGTAGPMYGNSGSFFIFVNKGDKYKTNMGRLTFYPLKGV